MMPLCKILEISVNELLSGEKLNEVEYHAKAEENIMNLMKEKEESKKKIILSAIVSTICIIACTALVLVAGIPEMPIPSRVALIATACIIVMMSISVACVLGCDTGAFECSNCGERFVPKIKAYIAGRHTLRRLKCPNCGEIKYCRRRLSK